MKIVKKPENDVIILNGVAWDRSNLIVPGQAHFTHEEAVELVKQQGKRLPTRKDINTLQALFRVEDADLKGMWFAESIKLLKTNKSLFLPFLGYKCSNEFIIDNEGKSFYFWGSEKESIRGTHFYFSGVGDYLGRGNISGDYQFCIRCVQDLE